MKQVLSMIQNLRLYSFVDLLLFLYVIGAREDAFWGGVSLWIFFLLYLEWRHNHSYRKRQPFILWLIFLALGLYLYPTIPAILFSAFVLLYTEKKTGKWALMGPIFRAAQMMALATPFCGIISLNTICIGLIFFIRNLLGDVRDTAKDIKEGLFTIPVAIGMKRNIPYVHMISVMTTSFVWCYFSTLPIFFLLMIWLVQITTYRLTPR